MHAERRLDLDSVSLRLGSQSHRFRRDRAGGLRWRRFSTSRHRSVPACCASVDQAAFVFGEARTIRGWRLPVQSTRSAWMAGLRASHSEPAQTREPASVGWSGSPAAGACAETALSPVALADLWHLRADLSCLCYGPGTNDLEGAVAEQRARWCWSTPVRWHPVRQGRRRGVLRPVALRIALEACHKAPQLSCPATR